MQGYHRWKTIVTTFFFCVMGSSGVLAGEFSGMLEQTLGVEHHAKYHFPAQNKTRIKLNMIQTPSATIDINLSVNGVLYSGITTVDVAAYLPKEDDALLSGMVRDALTTNYENDIWISEGYASYYGKTYKLRVGRQKLHSGTGYAFNPTDLLMKKNPLDPSYEKEGIDALFLEWNTWSETVLQLAYSFGTYQGSERRYEFVDDGDTLVRIKTLLSEWDLSLFLAKAIRSRYDIQSKTDGLLDDTRAHAQLKWTMLAGDFSGNLLSFGWHGEGGYVWLDPPAENFQFTSDLRNHFRGLIGMDYTFANQLQILVEYMFIGQGHRYSKYYTLNERMGFLKGERTTLGFDTLVLLASYPLSDYIKGDFLAISNINDGSLVLQPKFLWEVGDNLSTESTIRIPIGGHSRSQRGRLPSSAELRLRYFF